MLQEGFQPDFPAGTAEQLHAIQSRPPLSPSDSVRDLRSLLWSSIDNDSSRDLDQAEVAEAVPGGIRILVAIADVDDCVPLGSPLDGHAMRETTSVYTGIRTFPMLPEELSTDLTSLNEGVDRVSIVIEMVVADDGSLSRTQVYRALIRNQAQLTYNAVGAWLDGNAPAPPKIAAWPELEQQIRLQDKAARILLGERQRVGALNVDRVEAEAVVTDGHVEGINIRKKNRASELIENFMVAANGVMAKTLSDSGVSSIRRVVKKPERWPRIVEIAARYHETLPPEPDSGALSEFLRRRKASDPLHYADVSLAVMKLMGPGEYAVAKPGGPQPGHFALAAQNYTHSTAPNRRFADTVTQRLMKCVIARQAAPYTDEQLESIARNCTLREDAARKVERTMNKRIAAVALRPRIGEVFKGVVTGVTPKGTFVRIFDPPADGLLVTGHQGIDVGDQIQVKLVETDPPRGYLDFAIVIPRR